MYDWNDLRHFLAVARTGSTIAASKSLKVSQATVSRRVTVLEETIGAALFARSASGYALTPRRLSDGGWVWLYGRADCYCALPAGTGSNGAGLPALAALALAALRRSRRRG